MFSYNTAKGPLIVGIGQVLRATGPPVTVKGQVFTADAPANTAGITCMYVVARGGGGSVKRVWQWGGRLTGMVTAGCAIFL